MADLRIGVLGAARIAPIALVKPAGLLPGVKAAAAAARDPTRAAAFARRTHSLVVPSVHSVASMWSRRLFCFSLRVTGSRGEMRVANFIAPQYWNRLSVTIDGAKSHERVRGEASYAAQLRAFVAAVRDGGPLLTPPEDAVVTMRLIDDIYRAAGLPLRGEPAM